jgi:chromosome segregation ATPase
MEAAMSTFGWSPNDHRDELQQFQQRQEHEDAMKDTVKVATKLADEAIKLAEEMDRADGLVENIIDRLKESRAENALLRRSLSVLNNRIDELESVKNTEPVNLTQFSEEQQVQRVMTIVANRIGVRVEDLADWNATAKKLAADHDRIRADAEALLERLEHIAAVLKTFYFAELSMSSVQPILALAIEFNPDIVEQRR